MTTIACVWVAGHVPFTADYVTRLKAMVTRWMDRPFQFVCLTDRPWLLSGVDTVPIPGPMVGIKGWWSKIALFSPERTFSGRVLYLDLDTLVVGPLAPLIDFPAPFALVPDAGTFKPPSGRRCVKRFNSSVMVWDVGAGREVYDAYDPSVPTRLWGDQDLIGETCPGAATFPPAWCPRLSQVSAPPFDPDVKVILAKVPKNHIAVRQYPWFAPLWGAA